jgi:hypothetical protein
VIALIAVAVAIGAWFRPAGHQASPPIDPAAQYSDQQIGIAKTAMCAAYSESVKAVAGAAGRKNDDPNAQFTNIVNTRLAFHLTTDYFESQLNDNPATPPELKTAFKNLISAYNKLLLAQIAEAPQDQIDAASAKSDAADRAVVDSCK